MFKNFVYSIVIASAISAISSVSYAQKVVPFPSDVTKKSSRNARDAFFSDQAALNKFSIVSRSTLAEDKAAGEDSLDLFPGLHSAMFDEFNTNAAEWLQKYRGVNIQFEEGTTAFEKAEYNSKMIGFLRDMQDEGVGEDSRAKYRDGEYRLNIKAYRSPTQYYQMRDLFGDDVLNALGVNYPQGEVYSGKRTLVVDFKNYEGGRDLSSFNGEIKYLFLADKDQEFIQMASGGRSLIKIQVDPGSPDFSRLKESHDRLGNDFHISNLMPNGQRMPDGKQLAAFRVPTDSLSASELGDEVMVVTSAQPNNAVHVDRWMRIPMTAQGKLDSTKVGTLLEKPQAVIVNSPKQLASVYWMADPVFKAKVDAIKDAKKKAAIDKILRENLFKAEQKKAKSNKKMNEILDSLKDPSCPPEVK